MPLTIPPALWGRADGDVKLWVPFNGNLSKDISAFNQTATETTPTMAGGELTIVTGSSAQYIDYSAASSMGRSSGQPWTCECFINWTSSDNASPIAGIRYTIGANYYWFYVHGNVGKVVLDTADFGDAAGPTASGVLSGVGKVHMAMVYPSGSGAQTVRCYINGSQVLTFTDLAERTNSTGSVRIGKFASGYNCVMTFDDLRLTMRELYTGTSFTPPKSPL